LQEDIMSFMESMLITIKSLVLSSLKLLKQFLAKKRYEFIQKKTECERTIKKETDSYWMNVPSHSFIHSFIRWFIRCCVYVFVDCFFRWQKKWKKRGILL
jgi:hypothetical protein